MQAIETVVHTCKVNHLGPQLWTRILTKRCSVSCCHECHQERQIGCHQNKWTKAQQQQQHQGSETTQNQPTLRGQRSSQLALGVTAPENSESPKSSNDFNQNKQHVWLCMRWLNGKQDTTLQVILSGFVEHACMCIR